MEHQQFDPNEIPQPNPEEQPEQPPVAQKPEPQIEPPVDPQPEPQPRFTPPPENAWYSYPPRQTPIYPNNGYVPPAPPPPSGNKKGLRVFALVLAMVVLFICGVCAGYWTGLKGPLTGDTPTDANNGTQSSLQQQGNGEGKTSSFDITTGTKPDQTFAYEQIVNKVSPSIVNITIYSPDGESGSYASGIIMDAAKGYVLTNDHIYSEVPNAKFLITLNNGTEFKAEFVSGDSRSDIAILKIQNPSNLVAAEFNIDSLSVGEAVLAIGQSYGYADTVSEGIVSAVDRRVSLSSGSYSERYIQTTAAINPGNSGGALVNMYGQVVGVTSAKIASQEVEGLGFAIPSDRVLDIVANLQKNGKVVGRAKLGITYTEVGTVLSEVNGTPTGLLIQEITKDSDLYGKGFAQGDIITAINGKTITISSMVLDVIEDSKAGDTVELEIYMAKSKKTKKVTVKLGEAESSNSYTVSGGNNRADSSEPTGNDLPENPYEEYFFGR